MGMLLGETLGQVARLFGEVWPYLLLSVLVATALKLYADLGKVVVATLWRESDKKYDPRR
ncbi:MAG: hypothetical protein HY726_03885 [Candidatus Rokubacteria bacterium]|nr:hypothetical protein [Candidatus Rokubacteria bacterium]